MKEIVLPPLIEEPKILSDTVFTWEIDNWRQQNKKEHGPIFQAGGFPWYEPVFPRPSSAWFLWADLSPQADITLPFWQ